MVVLFDFDEVFVDLNTGALKYINNALNTKYSMSDLKSWDFFDKPEIRAPFLEYLSIPTVYQEHVIPNKKMIEVLKQMVEMDQKVFIVTASVESSQESKYNFIKEHMSFFDTKNLFTVNQSSKYKIKSDVLDELNLSYHEPIVLVDDGIHNILDMMADIKHKDRLDGMMKQFYNNKTLKKFNNPYHDFIYGIVPQLPYNKDIEDGKRIFKLKEAKDIWSIFKKIDEQHNIRVQTKQAEVFNYLNNIVNDLLPANTFKEVNSLQNNVSFLVKSLLGSHNKHADFLSDISRFSVKLESIIESNGINALSTQDSREVKKLAIENVFRSADHKFGSDAMYNEIKNLSILHSSPDVSPEHTKKGLEVSVGYNIDNKQLDLFAESLISSVITFSKENIESAQRLIKHADTNKEMIKELFSKTGVAYDVDFEDKTALLANTILAFNKNFKFNPQFNSLEVKDVEVEEIRKHAFAIENFTIPKKIKP